MTEVIVSLQLERSSSIKPFPERLAGFDKKDAKGRYKFFSLPDFADVIEAFLRINDKEKDGKPILCSVGMSVTTDSFSNLWRKDGRGRTGAYISQTKEVQASLLGLRNWPTVSNSLRAR